MSIWEVQPLDQPPIGLGRVDVLQHPRVRSRDGSDSVGVGPDDGARAALRWRVKELVKDLVSEKNGVAPSALELGEDDLSRRPLPVSSDESFDCAGCHTWPIDVPDHGSFNLLVEKRSDSSADRANRSGIHLFVEDRCDSAQINARQYVNRVRAEDDDARVEPGARCRLQNRFQERLATQLQERLRLAHSLRLTSRQNNGSNHGPALSWGPTPREVHDGRPSHSALGRSHPPSPLPASPERQIGGCPPGRPQIGAPIRIVYLEMEQPWLLVNPEVVDIGTRDFMVWDDCFSIPGLLVRVQRAYRIKLQYQDQSGKINVVDAKGDLAELLQHEIDHLDGVLMVDRPAGLDPFCLREEWNKHYSASGRYGKRFEREVQMPLEAV